MPTVDSSPASRFRPRARHKLDGGARNTEAQATAARCAATCNFEQCACGFLVHGDNAAATRDTQLGSVTNGAIAARRFAQERILTLGRRYIDQPARGRHRRPFART